MKIDPYDHNILIVGDSGSGKSNFVNWFAHSLPSNIPFWVWDYNHQHSYARTVSNVSDLGYERTVIQPRDLSEENFIRFAERADRAGNLVVIIEEVQEYVTPHKLVAESFFRTARNRGTTWVALTQRPAEISSALVSNAHHRIAFRLTHPNDVKFLCRWISPKMEQVQSLPPYYWLYHTKLVAAEPVKCAPVAFTERI